MIGLHPRNCSLMLSRCGKDVLPVCGFASTPDSSMPVAGGGKHRKPQEKGSDHTGMLIDPQEVKCDCVGPPDRQSNLRMTKFYIPPDETPLERRHREERFKTQEWNHRFWADHNTKFKKMKEEFIRVRLKEKYGENTEDQKTLSADEMSEFYKKFLDDHHLVHGQYNREWYKKNVNNLLIATRVWFQQRGNTRR
ncbi:cytochrome c oxidase assembly factor 8 [Procambarus clarkii]|uniref:cytochrome c oxidase assembly factor 8 n=1 Tax=Procambarus clarkii TaxID=6728 RepID=UPI00374281F6